MRQSGPIFNIFFQQTRNITKILFILYYHSRSWGFIREVAKSSPAQRYQAARSNFQLD